MPGIDLDANAKAANVKRSLDRHCRIVFAIDEGIDVDYEGLPFDNRTSDEWIAPRILTLDSMFHRQASVTTYGETINILYHVNIFVKKDSMSYADRHYALRDIVAKNFKIGEKIELYDFAEGGTDRQEWIKIRRIITDQPMPPDIGGESQNLYQYAFAVEMDYTRTTTNSIIGKSVRWDWNMDEILWDSDGDAILWDD